MEEVENLEVLVIEIVELEEHARKLVTTSRCLSTRKA